MELQDNLESLRADGINPYAISYDPVDTLADFATEHEITYPLLSDTNSDVMKAFGIFNRTVPENHRWYGIPYPGTYMVDEHGIVFDRSFYADHIARDSISRMTQDVFRVESPAHGTLHQIQSSAYTASVHLSSDTIRRGQVHTLTVHLVIEDGYHVQASPLPKGYIPLTISVGDIEGVNVDPLDYPEAAPYRIPGLDDQLHVYTDEVTLKTAILFNVPEDLTLTVRLEAQACTDRDCMPPETHTFEIPLTWLSNP